jgi:hypothetical protein
MHLPSVVTILLAINAIVTSGSADTADTNVSSPHVDQTEMALGQWIPSRMELGIEPPAPSRAPSVYPICDDMIDNNPKCHWLDNIKVCCGEEDEGIFVIVLFGVQG